MAPRREKTTTAGVYKLVDKKVSGRDVFVWELKVNLPPSDGKYPTKFFRVTGKYADAQREKARLDRAYSKSDASRVNWTMNQLVAEHKRVSVNTKNNIREDQNRWNTLKKEWGERKVTTMTGHDITAIMAAVVNRGNANSTANRYRTQLQSLFNTAIKLHIREDNPVKESVKYKEDEVDETLIDVEHSQKLLALLPDDHAEFFQLAYELGRRRGDINALRVSSWNTRTRQITVGKSIQVDEFGNITVGSTKGRTTRTWVPTPEAIEIIESRIEKLRRSKTRVSPDDFLFSDDGGKTPWKPTKVTRYVRDLHKSICPTSGCDYHKPRSNKTIKICPRCDADLGVNITLKSMRALNYSVQIENGVAPKKAVKNGGWANEKIASRNYHKVDLTGEDVKAHAAIASIGIKRRSRVTSVDDSLSKASAS